MQHRVVQQNVIPGRSFPRIHSLLATQGGLAASCPRHLPDYPTGISYVSYFFHSQCKPDDFDVVFIFNLCVVGELATVILASGCSFRRFVDNRLHDHSCSPVDADVRV